MEAVGTDFELVGSGIMCFNTVCIQHLSFFVSHSTVHNYVFPVLSHNA